ncbi:hypothetical protein WJX72_008220 [[Myrmecia] bisecta]|uniref:Protein kinase domain-containing protein n=1 Tax=[Myrmecia] bisecta TaxID=41462 RepID=A0AAW1QSD4_9CHLO
MIRGQSLSQPASGAEDQQRFCIRPAEASFHHTFAEIAGRPVLVKRAKSEEYANHEAEIVAVAHAYQHWETEGLKGCPVPLLHHHISLEVDATRLDLLFFDDAGEQLTDRDLRDPAVFEYCFRIARALRKAGLVNADIKRGHLRRDKQGRIRLIDWDFAIRIGVVHPVLAKANIPSGSASSMTVTCKPDGFCRTAPSAKGFQAHERAARLDPLICPVSPALWAHGSTRFDYVWPDKEWPAAGGDLIVETVFTRSAKQIANKIERDLISLDAADRDPAEALHPLRLLDRHIWAALYMISCDDLRGKAASEYMADVYWALPRCRLLALRGDLLWLVSCDDRELRSEWGRKDATRGHLEIEDRLAALERGKEDLKRDLKSGQVALERGKEDLKRGKAELAELMSETTAMLALLQQQQQQEQTKPVEKTSVPPTGGSGCLDEPT